MIFALSADGRHHRGAAATPVSFCVFESISNLVADGDSLFESIGEDEQH